MSKFIDLTGQKFGRLLVIEIAGRNKHQHVLWMCLCDCGNTTIKPGSSLRNGGSRSCGCLHLENIKNDLLKHGYSAKGNKGMARTYKSLMDARDRCYSKRVRNYKDYGGRGIVICDRWLGEEGVTNFIEDMGEKPEGTSLDRIDNDGNYCPENCRWATKEEQANNKRTNHYLTYKGETKTLSQWALVTGIGMKTLSARSINGWSDEKVIETPVRASEKK